MYPMTVFICQSIRFCGFKKSRIFATRKCGQICNDCNHSTLILCKQQHKQPAKKNAKTTLVSIPFPFFHIFTFTDKTVNEKP